MATYKKFMVWQERDGTCTPIPQLRTSHLEFIIAKIKRSADTTDNGKLWRGKFLPFLEEELEYRLLLDINRKTT